MKNAALLRLACSTAAAAIAVTAGGVAFADSGKDADAISYYATSDTYAKLFRRAPAPGPPVVQIAQGRKSVPGIDGSV